MVAGVACVSGPNQVIRGVCRLQAGSGHIRLMSNADVSYNESLVNGQILRPLFYPKVDIKASNLD
jgi:hypothetical protein